MEQSCPTARQQESHQAAAGDLESKYLHVAERESVVITRHGKPAGLLIGFASDDDWFEYRVEHDPQCVRRIASARERLRQGRGVRCEEVPWD